MSKKIDTVFVLALITLFAATAFMLVLIGAKQYRYVTNTMNENYEARTIASYLTEKIRQNDTAGHISVVNLEGTTALALRAQEDDFVYTTYIYYYEGSLRELVTTENSVFTLSSGQSIMEVQGFTPTLLRGKLLHITATDTLGKEIELYLPLHSDSVPYARKEAL